MRITKRVIIAGTGIVALVAAGGAAFAATDTAADTAVTVTAAASASAPKVTAERAIEIAHREVPGAWVSELDYDRRDSRPDVWEIELFKGSQVHEVDVDAASGKVVKRETDRSDRDDDD
ncbi:MAG TPA: PepSY domain-containing protein [Nonomuraea sp.]|nr:PepSY domain-containing protein [Nonomuraea sp.]